MNLHGIHALIQWELVLSFLQHSSGLMCNVTSVETSLAWKHQPALLNVNKVSFCLCLATRRQRDQVFGGSSLFCCDGSCVYLTLFSEIMVFWPYRMWTVRIGCDFLTGQHLLFESRLMPPWDGWNQFTCSVFLQAGVKSLQRSLRSSE